MCYSQKIKNKETGISISISDCFGDVAGFNWNDEEFINAVKNRDEKLWVVLDWIALGGAEEYDRAQFFIDLISGINSSGDLAQKIDQFIGREVASQLIKSRYLDSDQKFILYCWLSGTMEGLKKAKPAKITKAKNIVGGFVYLLRAENGLYKIGRTIDLSKRMMPFSVKFPMEWELLHSFYADDYVEAEKLLHEKHETKRKIGEWFDLDDGESQAIELIYSYKNGGFETSLKAEDKQ